MTDTVRSRRGRAGVRRLWPVAAIAALAVVSIPSPAGADDARPAFVNGDAKASANLFDFKVQISGAVGSDSGLAIGFGSGRALTQYQDATANAEGRAIDYSLTDLINMQPTPECPDVIPLFLDSTKPPVTLAESTDPAAATAPPVTVHYAGFPTQGPEFGTQSANAGPGTTAHATTTAKLVDSGVISMVNPRSESTSRVVDGVREAVATSTADSLSVMGGAMTLFRPTWTAVARSGATTAASATFTYGSAQILGFTRPGGNTADLQAFKGFLESTFSGLGMKLILPAATVTPGPDGTGQVSISPMQVAFENIPLAGSLVAPVLRLISPQIDQAVAHYLAQKCSNPALQLISDVVRGIASGKGGLSFAIGGADAMTDDVYYPPVDLSVGDGSALGDSGPALSVPLDSGTGVLGADLSSGLGTTSVDLTPAPIDTLPVAESTTSAPPVGPEESAAGPEVATVRRAADRSRPGHTGGTAGWITLVGLAAVIALAGADHFVMRRSRRRFAP